jgi:hypothetical protein
MVQRNTKILYTPILYTICHTIYTNILYKKTPMKSAFSSNCNFQPVLRAFLLSVASFSKTLHKVRASAAHLSQMQVVCPSVPSFPPKGRRETWEKPEKEEKSFESNTSLLFLWAFQMFGSGIPLVLCTRAYLEHRITANAQILRIKFRFASGSPCPMSHAHCLKPAAGITPLRPCIS